MNDHLIHRIDQNNVSADQWIEIYKNGGWGGEGSGLGSALKNNFSLLHWFTNFIENNNIKSILDLGCGDLQWFPILFNIHKELRYTGVDCVPDLIDSHRKNYPDHNFILYDFFHYTKPYENPNQLTLDINSDPYISDKFDLLLCKDVLQHNVKNADPLLSTINKINARIKVLIAPMNVTWPLNNSYIYVSNYWIGECKNIYIKVS